MPGCLGEVDIRTSLHEQGFMAIYFVFLWFGILLNQLLAYSSHNTCLYHQGLFNMFF